MNYVVNCEFYSHNPESIYVKAGSEKEALETAEYVSPCVLWIDEIEKGLKESSSSNTTSKMIGQFLWNW